jgi:hypothetical protein
MIVISLGFLFAFFVRLPFFGINSELNVLTTTSYQIIWMSMYFFVFEMRRFADQILSADLRDHIKRR